MVEPGEGGKSPGSLDDRTAIAGIGREGDQHAALFVTFEATTAEPNGGGGEWFVFFIEDRDHFSSAGCGGENFKLALANHGAAALAAANELDDPHSPAVGDLGEDEVPRDAMLGRFLVFNGALVIGDQAVEIEVRADLATVFEIVVEGVHLKDLHNESFNILDVDAQFYLIRDAKHLRAVGRELDVDAILQGLEGGGAEK